MSRSRKKRLFHGITTAESEKEDKQLANRRERRVNKQIIKTTQDGDRVKTQKEISDPWCMAKDGKLRFDPKELPKLRRK